MEWKMVLKSLNCRSNWLLRQHHNRDYLLLLYYVVRAASKSDEFPRRRCRLDLAGQSSLADAASTGDYRNPFQTQADMSLAHDCMLRSSQSPSSSASHRLQWCWALIWSRQFRSRLVVIESSSSLLAQLRLAVEDDVWFHRPSSACIRCGNSRRSVSKRSSSSKKWCQEERNHEKVMQTYRMSTQTYRRSGNCTVVFKVFFSSNVITEHTQIANNRFSSVSFLIIAYNSARVVHGHFTTKLVFYFSHMKVAHVPFLRQMKKIHYPIRTYHSQTRR